MLTTIRTLFQGMARILVRRSGRQRIVLQAYRGYGSCEEFFLMGRVFKQPGFAASAEPIPQRDVADLAKLLLVQGVGGAVLTIQVGATRQRVVTDRHGYFRVRMRLPEPPPSDQLWHRVDIEMVRPVSLSTKGEFFAPPDQTRFVVISDIDDTVMDTGVSNRLAMLQRLFLQTAEKRIVFPGVAALYRALHLGLSGRELNPMLYVSRAPWSIYPMLERFFRLHAIPVGPILFLREWGMTLQHPLPHRIKGHKLNLIRGMLSLYGDLPFVLIGDSGQQDPEIYTRVVEEHPGRVLAVYIRNVTRAPDRRRAIEALAKRVVDAGSSLVLAADSFAMAEHAVEHGLISTTALAEVLGEKTQQDEPDLKSVREVTRPSPAQTREAIDQGELAEAIEADTGEESPPNVIVQSEQDRTAARLDRPPP